MAAAGVGQGLGFDAQGKLLQRMLLREGSDWLVGDAVGDWRWGRGMFVFLFCRYEDASEWKEKLVVCEVSNLSGENWRCADAW